MSKLKKTSIFSKSKSIELGGIPSNDEENDQNGYMHRRRSHADIETMQQMNGISYKNNSLPNSLKSVNFSEKVYSSDGDVARKGVTSNGSASNEKTLITQDTLDQIREVELEDILMNARNITEPDSTANMSFCPQPAKVIEGTFRHSVAVREVDSKTGAFRHRTIDILRNPEDELGFSVRQGDGWEKHDGIFVSRISLGSVYDKFELMKVGDEIVKINRVEIKNMDVDSVIRVMHIPEKLSLTIKILTPFSKKRVSKSTIANENKKANHKYNPNISESKATPASNYKIAQMKIGMSTENAKKSQDSRENKKSEQDNTKKEEPSSTKASSQTTGRSPYRVGATQRQLSPIRETASEEKITKASSTVHVSNTRRTSVTWLDQRSPGNECAKK